MASRPSPSARPVHRLGGGRAANRVSIGELRADIGGGPGAGDARVYTLGAASAAPAGPLPLVVFIGDRRSARRGVERFASRLVLGLSGCVVELMRAHGDEDVAGSIEWVRRNAAEWGGAPGHIGVVASRGGADAAYRAFTAGDAIGPGIARLSLISPERLAPAASFDALPPCLLQVAGRPEPGSHDPAVAELTRAAESGVAARIVEYPGRDRDWIARPRSVRGAADRAESTIAFLRRGLVDDSFDVIPSWGLR